MAKKKITNVITELKPLPRLGDGSISRKFTANGINYTIRDASQVVSPKRHQAFNLAMMQLQMNMNLDEYATFLNDVETLTYNITGDVKTRTPLILKTVAARESMVRRTQEQSDLMMYICCFFIVEDDEDLRYFDYAIAEKKITNWNEEGFSVEDFFSVAAFMLPNFPTAYNAKKVRLQSV